MRQPSLLLGITLFAVTHLARGQQLPPECAPPGTNGRTQRGVGMENTGQISYSAANMPAVEAQLIDDPGGRRYENVIDCRWLLRCSDDTLVPRVTFSAFAT
jgi:hypothetical protein